MVSVWLSGRFNPHHLLPPSEAWQRKVHRYDSDLRVFPSSQRPVYRVARVRRMSTLQEADKARIRAQARKLGHGLSPDLQYALDQNLIFVNWSLKADAFTVDADGTQMLATLRRRDSRVLTAAKGTDSDALADRIQELESEEDAAKDAAFKDQRRQIGRAARLSVLYRTGQRISMHVPLRKTNQEGAPSPSIPLETTEGLVDGHPRATLP